MKHIDTKQLRAALTEYTQPSTGLALIIFTIDIAIYMSAIAGVIFLENITMRVLCSILAGIMISSIFVIGHDAAHNAFTGSRIMNKVIARMAFLPSLHNYGLWLTEHNRIHHVLPNIQGMDSWSPFSKEEYDAMPAWRRVIERFYRSPAGMGFYYLVERWWKNKFYPYKKIIGKYNSVYWDFLLVVTYLVTYLCLLGYAGRELAHTSAIELIVLGFVIPFLNWNFMMGFTVYQHHTHESIPWVRTRVERDQLGGQEDFTMYVRYPAWYNLLSHNIMLHTPHHVDPRIPLYCLPKAQKAMAELMGDELKTVSFSLKGFLKTMASCKLYDYENHLWLDFAGYPTGKSTLAGKDVGYRHAA
jgi:omega-6 fatty acid desaturase (delta-12 desaturase)